MNVAEPVVNSPIEESTGSQQTLTQMQAEKEKYARSAKTFGSHQISDACDVTQGCSNAPVQIVSEKGSKEAKELSFNLNENPLRNNLSEANF